VPYYPFKCLKCGKGFEELQSIKARDHKGFCPDCGSPGKRTWGTFSFSFDWDFHHNVFDHGAGRTFESSRERDTFLDENNMRRRKS